jgi:hypothetical protein
MKINGLFAAGPKSLTLLTLSLIAFGCQKEEPMLPVTSVDMKTSPHNYNNLKTAIGKQVETETYCENDYLYTASVFINGVEWQYPDDGYEYLMYKGLMHHGDVYNDYYFAPLEFPADGYEYGIGFGNRSTGPGVYFFDATVEIDVPEKQYAQIFKGISCFAMGDSTLTHTDSIRIVLHKKVKKDLVIVPDTVLTFAALKEKLGTAIYVADSISISSSFGKLSSYAAGQTYNWDYYGAGTTEIYGLQNAGSYSSNLSFGDGLIGNCSGPIDIYLHSSGKIYKCSTYYSIVYTTYEGCRKQLHIYSPSSL